MRRDPRESVEQKEARWRLKVQHTPVRSSSLDNNANDDASTPTTTQAKIDVAKGRYPYCVVWSPLPLLTWILPFIGHMGITNSEGVIFDFAGPYTIGKGK